MFKSTIFKLTISYILLATVLCLIFSGILFDISKRELNEGLENQEKYITSDSDRDKQQSKITQEVIDQRVNSDKVRVLCVDAVVILVSVGGSYILARRTIRPVREAYDEQLRFVADASHELRTPLAEMRLGTEVALRDKETLKNNKKLKEVLGQNLEDIDDLQNLTNRLLNISRYKSGLVKNHMDTINLELAVDKAVEKLASYSKKQSVKIKLDLKPVKMHGIAIDIEQAIAILIENAIKYSNPKGTVNVRVYKKGMSAIVEVEDHGIGIDRKDLNHIFTTFYRSKSKS